MNPGRITVDTADQPIFTHTKKLRIQFPEKFGLDKYFYLFGSLHIEMVMLIICGQVIKGKGLDEIMCTCGLSVVGADFLVTVNNIKRARYSIQARACVIYLKLKQASMDTRVWGIDSFMACQQKQDNWNVLVLESDPQTYDWFLCLNMMSYIMETHTLVLCSRPL